MKITLTLGVAIMLACIVWYAWPKPAAPLQPAAAAKAVSIPKKMPNAPAKEQDAETKHYRPAPVSAQVQQKVEAILRRHQGMTKEQLQRSAELNKLMDRFIAVLGTPEMQVKMEQRIAAIPPVKGAEHGTLKMDFDMLDDAHGRAWLEAAVSDDTQRIEDWVLNTLDGAIFEFAFDPALERTSNGVSVQPGTTAKPEPSADDKAKD
ncbi:hypothetical protein [Prosthecobacter sp.]|uniref:hypothetical protein n=1 Tax=Prosthecobacter sp. TaxID=1965333 RepID=UPI002ABB3FC2|nr:hypothetical protein [Prosthecobacter sp.]MDZ4401716.1 hypothetical protein [Prosthecobacter sp.]